MSSRRPAVFPEFAWGRTRAVGWCLFAAVVAVGLVHIAGGGM